MQHSVLFICIYKHILGKCSHWSQQISWHILADPSTWLCLQWGICYTDAEPQAPNASHEPKLVFRSIRLNFRILEVWAPHLPLYVAICIECICPMCILMVMSYLCITAWHLLCGKTGKGNELQINEEICGFNLGIFLVIKE